MEIIKKKIKDMICREKGVIDLTDENIDFFFSGATSFKEYDVDNIYNFDSSEFKPSKLLMIIKTSYDAKLSEILRTVNSLRSKFDSDVDEIIFGVYESRKLTYGIETLKVIAIK